MPSVNGAVIVDNTAAIAASAGAAITSFNHGKATLRSALQSLLHLRRRRSSAPTHGARWWILIGICLIPILGSFR